MLCCDMSSHSEALNFYMDKLKIFHLKILVTITLESELPLVVYPLQEAIKSYYHSLHVEITTLITVIYLQQQFVLMVLPYSLQKTNGDISHHSLLHGVYQKRSS